MLNMHGEFNTIRLGGFFGKNLTVGAGVLLVDAKSHTLIGTAMVTGLHLGKLRDIAPEHARHNHNRKDDSPDVAVQNLIAAMIKRYGPHKCKETSLVSVVYLRMSHVPTGEDRQEEAPELRCDLHP
ncbi:hypothetical protein [Cupriavidus metallidurans]|uniref:hypothetical protein n=1 Tax=Cupriavidus metallidurans TaxID=119219 RepID=UPI001CCE4080|nr:hypothetical protein [Cupriavidus metallidurans]UBM12715.1 hypothetical protein LAI70_28290 [Cupriavidus metallidurans]